MGGELKTAVDQWMDRERKEREENPERAVCQVPSDLDSLLWETLVRLQNRPFHTAKDLEFTYKIRGNEMFVDRKDKSITRATVMLSFHRALIRQLEEGKVTGPKKLGTFGASYLYPVFLYLEIIRPGDYQYKLKDML